MKFSLVIIVFILFLSVGLIPSPLYFLFLAPLDRQGQWRGAADKTSHVHSRNDRVIEYRAPFLLMKTETTLAGASCVLLTLRKGSRAASIWAGGAGPPCFSSFSIIVLWHWCLPVWLSLSVTLYHLCFSRLCQYWNLRLTHETKQSRQCVPGMLFNPLKGLKP